MLNQLTNSNKDKIISDIANKVNDHYYIRNLRDEFIFCNQAMSTWHGYNTPQQMCGLKPSDCFLIQQLSQEYISFDKHILNQKTTETMFSFVQNKNGTWVVTYDRKYPHHDETGNLVGVAGISMILSTHCLPELVKLSFLQKLSPQVLIVKNSYNTLLTKKENEILYFYLRGMSAKEIAKAISLSNRTVETHISSI